jgi:hypothetical protein
MGKTIWTLNIQHIYSIIFIHIFINNTYKYCYMYMNFAATLHSFWFLFNRRFYSHAARQETKDIRVSVCVDDNCMSSLWLFHRNWRRRQSCGVLREKWVH